MDLTRPIVASPDELKKSKISFIAPSKPNFLVIKENCQNREKFH